VKYIYETTSSYEAQIMSRDENFFLTSSFEEHKENVDLDIFSKMKVYFATMSGDSKESVWKYSQNILRLAKACHSFANSS
jgi:hypothetical protein